MIVLDTHAWLWWVHSPCDLSPAATAAINDDAVRGVSVVSCWEIAVLVRKNRIRLDRSADQWVQHALSKPGLRLLPLEPLVAVRAGGDVAGLHGDPADRFIALTAMSLDCPLVTKDEQLRTLPGLVTIW